MATLAPPAPFDAAKESWDVFMSRFDFFILSHAIPNLTDDRKKAIFLSNCGHEVFETARILAEPATLQATTWKDLTDALQAYYAPVPSKFVKRHEFRHRMQHGGESISQYMSALRKAATHCAFNNVDDSLLDQLIFGVRDLRLQRRLLTNPDLTLRGAMDEARAAETASNAADSLQKLAGTAAAEKPALAVNQGRAAAVLEESDEERYEIDQTTKKEREPKRRCPSCGGQHPRTSCRFREFVCRRCGRKGHLAKVCRAPEPAESAAQTSPPSRRQERPQRDAKQGEKAKKLSEAADTYRINVGRNTGYPGKKIHITVLVCGEPCRMEIDSGSAISIISWATLKRILPDTKKDQLRRQQLQIRDYQGKRLPVLGLIDIPVSFKKFEGQLPVTVVAAGLPSLLGLEWFEALGLGITGIHSTVSPWGNDLIEEYSDVFSQNLGKYTGRPISISLDPMVAPIRLKPRRVPFALKAKLDEELDKLIKQGILVPTENARWETPIVTPVKKDGSIRICADYKCTINKALQLNAYPVPVMQHLLHSLGAGSVFAKLDLAQAYQQLPVDGPTAEAQTIVTHRGAFKVTRLQFGISVAPGIFQGVMERLLRKIPGVVPYFDDVLVTATSHDQLQTRLRQIFEVFRVNGLKLRKDKCLLGVPSVDFLGYRIDGAGIHPTKDKVRAIKDAPVPKSRTDLQSFLGLLNFYHCFLKGKATVADPLHRLLSKKTPWVWGQREAAAFAQLKNLLSSDQVLVRYNTTLPVTLTCDASPFGIGAVLSHTLPSGKEAPVAFYSRTLTSAERNYSQIDKEALALVASVRRFHEYLFGRRFTLVTDHKPLLGILAGDRPTPSALSPRMVRWSLVLAAYSYQLIHKPGCSVGHADALSRCPLPGAGCAEEYGDSDLLIDCLDSSLITSREVAAASLGDPVVRTVQNWVRRGWPGGKLAAEFGPFNMRRGELAVQGNCLLWGDRVVIPAKLQQRILGTLHECHPGIVRMKALARSFVWWPALDKDIEKLVTSCSACQQSRPAPPRVPLQNWERPRAPWSRLHLDFAGPFHGQMFLILVDAFSKWMEVHLMKDTKAPAVAQYLETLFITHGLPDVVVTDNGPQFVATQFEEFMAARGIRHMFTAPFHPSSNGLAERAVRTVKEALSRLGPGNWKNRIEAFLRWQHITPSRSTGKSPAELLFGRKLRSILDRLHPDYAPEVGRQANQVPRCFGVGDSVWARNYAQGPKWEMGKVEKILGSCSYVIKLCNGKVWHRHVDQLRSALSETPAAESAIANKDSGSSPGYFAQEDQFELPEMGPFQRWASFDCPSPSSVDGPGVQTDSALASPAVPEEAGGSNESPSVAEPRRSGRQGKKPAYLKNYVC